jgi:hypothetical protein
MTWWHKLALGTVPVTGIFVCAVLLRVFLAEPAVFADLHATVKSFQVAADTGTTVLKSANTLAVSANTRVVALGTTQAKLDTGIDLMTHRLTDLCSAPQGCGLIPDASRTLNTTRGTLGQVEIAARSFDQHQSTFYTQEDALAARSQKTFADLDSFITNPDLTDTFHNVNITSLAFSHTAQNLDATTTDGKTWLHQKLFPTKKKGFLSAFEATGDAAKHWMPSLF